MPKLTPLAECRLYTFVDTGYLADRDPEALARSLCEGGADLVQLRAKGSSEAEVRRWAERLLPITEAAGVWLVVNDHPGIAAEIGAPLCHLGQEDFFDAGLTRISELPALAGPPASRRPPPDRQPAGMPPVSQPTPLKPNLLVGLSTHAPAQAERAVAAGAAYVAIGPVFATPTKPGRSPVTLDYVRWAATHLRLPWFAIGGITLDNLDAVMAAGARRVCVVSAILNAPDVAQACRAFKERLTSPTQ